MSRIVALLDTCTDWLMTPLGRVKDKKRRLIFRALRSRFFLIVAIFTAVPLLLQAVAATAKAIHPKADAGHVLPWMLAGTTWTLFILTVLFEKWRLDRRSKRTDELREARNSLRQVRKKLNK